MTTETTIDIADSTRVRCDPERLKEAIENLLRNAIEHNERSVSIRAGVLPDRGGVYVEDDGEGIPAAERGRVFDSGYTTIRKGTGFGLSIVVEIIDAHGGSVRVRDAESGGARFELTGIETVS